MTHIFTTALVLAALVSEASIAQTQPPAAAAPAAPAAAAPPPVTSAPATAAPPPTKAAASASGDSMEGLAAYYSDKLNGHKTASGQVLDQNALTAAHPSLPFGTKVKVTNTKNGRSVVVRINDRGPTQAGRVIDLTRAAAKQLGMAKAGTIPVKLEVVGEAPAKKTKQ
jgi:rare lipoprotein A